MADVILAIQERTAGRFDLVMQHGVGEGTGLQAREAVACRGVAMEGRPGKLAPPFPSCRQMALELLGGSDPETVDHCIRVARQCSAMSRALGIHGQKAFDIELAAIVHAIPTSEDGPQMQQAKEIVRHQRERYDGRGGPDGLRAAEIPLGSRILAIADTFEHARTRSAFSDEWLRRVCAFDALQPLSGINFDPALLELFGTCLGCLASTPCAIEIMVNLGDLYPGMMLARATMLSDGRRLSPGCVLGPHHLEMLGSGQAPSVIWILPVAAKFAF